MEKVRGVLLAIQELDRPFYLIHGTPGIGRAQDGPKMIEYL
jgi:hypothetical protein